MIMFTNAVLTSFAALLCSSLGLVDARIVQRDVVSPPITYPTTGTVWQVNDRHNVTWDTSVIPPGFTSTGMIVLGFLDDADGENEHLDLDNPLAQGFPITDGRTEITVPSVTTRNTYILVLFGDSGNASGKFTIKNISIGPSSSSTASSSVVSSTAASASASATSTEESSSSAESAEATSGASSSAAASSSQAASAAATASGTASGATSASKATGTAPASIAVPSGSGSTIQVSPAAQSAGSATTNPNASIRAASFGGAATWLSVIFSLTVIVGFSL